MKLDDEGAFTAVCVYAHLQTEKSWCVLLNSTADCAHLLPSLCSLLDPDMAPKLLQSTQAWKLEDSSLRTQFNKIQADM